MVFTNTVENFFIHYNGLKTATTKSCLLFWEKQSFWSAVGNHRKNPGVALKKAGHNTGTIGSKYKTG